jgi:hypothetical protein
MAQDENPDLPSSPPVRHGESPVAACPALRPPVGAYGIWPDGAAVESIETDRLGQAVLRLRGHEEPYVDVRIARCFPWSLPETYISICDKDGKELALLRDLAGLPEPTREIIRRELRDKAFSPRIQRVVSCKSEFGVTSITAQTDRGEVTFQVRSRDDVRILSARRALFRDADGISYELSDLHAIDSVSRRHLQDFF